MKDFEKTMKTVQFVAAGIGAAATVVFVYGQLLLSNVL